MPRLEYLLTVRAELRESVADIGSVPGGTRRIFDVSGGEFEGPRLKGRVLASGGDWLLVGHDGVGRLDVRATFATHDGALVYVQYPGILTFSPEVVAAIGAGGETDFGASYFMTTPRFETGDERYAWLNRIVAVGQGRMLPNAVEYRIFEVQND
jgi:hypothetical protein